MTSTVIVVPCFDEEHRLRGDAFLAFREKEPDVEFLFVNDGSRDRTLAVLRDIQARDPHGIGVLDQPRNQGKAEAVRAGLRAAAERNPTYLGYWDADLATPLAEIPRLRDELENHAECELVLGARVQLLGRAIRRRMLRHYLGRVFATVVSNVLRLRVYDTQCGAKMLRCTPGNLALFERPFATSWVFDVELIARMIRQRSEAGLPPAREVIRELPLLEWTDVPGSKVSARDFLVALRDVLTIYRRELLPVRRSRSRAP